MAKIVDRKEFNLDDDIFYTRTLYVGKLGYQNPYGNYHECEDRLVVGVYDCNEKKLEDILNFKKYTLKKRENAVG